MRLSAWRIDGERCAAPKLWETLRCTFAPRLCALGIVSIIDMYGGRGPAEAGRHEGRWLSYSELRATFDDGKMGTNAGDADVREYNRLIAELDGSEEALRWRRARAASHAGASVSDELRGARALLRARKAPRAMAVIAARHTQPSIAPMPAPPLEYRVQWETAAQLPDEWVSEERLAQLIAAASMGAQSQRAERRLAAQRDHAAARPTARCFSEYLTMVGKRELMAVALAQPLLDDTAAARMELLQLFEDYSQHVQQAEGRSARSNLQPHTSALEALRWSADECQTAFGGSGKKDPKTGKLAFGVHQGPKDIAAGRPAVPHGLEALPLQVRALVAFGEDMDNPRRFLRARRVGLGDDLYWTNEAVKAHPILRAHVRSYEMEQGNGMWVFYPDGQKARRVIMEPKELAAMNGVQSRHFVAALLLMAQAGGCTHFAATDGSRIGAEAS